jgi:IS1 family transposase
MSVTNSDTPMIQTHIHLPKSSYLFKTLKKKKLLEDNKSESLFIWLNYKPNIGELIEISCYNVKDEDFQNYLYYRKKPIIVRITDLVQSYFPLINNPIGATVLNLKVYEDDSVNWY